MKVFSPFASVKIIIRGERNTGKTQLFNRLQGKAFSNDYIATKQIQTAVLSWSFKSNSLDENVHNSVIAFCLPASDEVVKVELWDVVDKGSFIAVSAG